MQQQSELGTVTNHTQISPSVIAARQAPRVWDSEWAESEWENGLGEGIIRTGGLCSARVRVDTRKDDENRSAPGDFSFGHHLGDN